MKLKHTDLTLLQSKETIESSEILVRGSHTKGARI